MMWSCQSFIEPPLLMKYIRIYPPYLEAMLGGRDPHNMESSFKGKGKSVPVL